MHKRGFTQISTSESKGFTLIELLVVIAIIGLLASVVLASLGTARAKGRDAKRISDIKEIQLALQLYEDANNQYPTTLDPLAPNYISTIPKDPLTGDAYSYVPLKGTLSTSCGAYHLGATLEQPNAALDDDFDGTVGGTFGTGKGDGAVCGSATDFNGSDSGSSAAGVFDERD